MRLWNPPILPQQGRRPALRLRAALVTLGTLCLTAGLLGCDDAASSTTPAADTVADTASQDASNDDALADAASAGSDTSAKDQTAKDQSGSDAVFGAPCPSVAKQVLGPIGEVSEGQVTVLQADGKARTLYVDASAGGYSVQAAYPRLYLNLETAQAVPLTDYEAMTSTAWDLALKRPVLYTNGGTGGPGQGQVGFVFKPFAEVTAADEAASDPQVEQFWDDACTPALDPIGSVLTTMSDWYSYEDGTSAVVPKNLTFVLRGGTGKLYKLKIQEYYASPDGTKGKNSGHFVLLVEPL